MARRSRTIVSLVLVIALVALSAWVTIWTFTSPMAVQRFLVRLVVISLIIFLAVLFVRYFTLLWFGFLQLLEKTMEFEVDDESLPPVSIIVPAYNEGTVLGAAIDALLRIDYPTFEIIVVDDGSFDETRTLLDSFQDRIRLIIHPENRGVSAARNSGIKASKSPS